MCDAWCVGKYRHGDEHVSTVMCASIRRALPLMPGSCRVQHIRETDQAGVFTARTALTFFVRPAGRPRVTFGITVSRNLPNQ